MLPRRVSAWVKTTAAAYNPVIHWGSDVATTNIWRLAITAEGKVTVTTDGSATTTAAVNDGQWHHIEAVLPPGGISGRRHPVLIDGLPAPSTSTPGNPNWINTGAPAWSISATTPPQANATPA